MFASVLAAKKFQFVLALGSLVGSSLFITSFVVAMIIFISGRSKVDRAKFLRDAGTLLLTVVIILVYGFIGRIEFIQASGFLVIYAIYVVTVIYTEQRECDSVVILDSHIHSIHFEEPPNMIVDSLSTEMYQKNFKPIKDPLSFSALIKCSILKCKLYWQHL